MDINSAATVQHLARPDGSISYTVVGEGPLVVAVPGMGDLRGSLRELVGPLVAAGYRIAVTDLRGHGDSTTGFSEHGDEATAGDLLALVRELGGGPAVLIGNSMGAGAGVIAAAEAPREVAGLVGLGPFLRNPPAPAAMRAVMPLLYRVVLARPWGARFWRGYYASLNRGRRAPWLDEHLAALYASFRDPARLRQFRRLTLVLTHEPAERRIDAVEAPMLQVYGALDPDYDVVVESEWAREHGAQVLVVDDAGHYPHAQRPDVTVPAVLEFLAGLRDPAASGGWRMPQQHAQGSAAKGSAADGAGHAGA